MPNLFFSLPSYITLICDLYNLELDCQVHFRFYAPKEIAITLKGYFSCLFYLCGLICNNTVKVVLSNLVIDSISLSLLPLEIIDVIQSLSQGIKRLLPFYLLLHHPQN